MLNNPKSFHRGDEQNGEEGKIDTKFLEKRPKSPAENTRKSQINQYQEALESGEDGEERRPRTSSDSSPAPRDPWKGQRVKRLGTGTGTKRRSSTGL